METAAGGHRQPHGAAGRKGKCVRGEEENTSLSTAARLEARRAMWQYCGAAVVEAATIRPLCASCTQRQTVSCDCCHRRAAVAVCWTVALRPPLCGRGCAVCCVSCRTASHRRLTRSAWCVWLTASSCHCIDVAPHRLANCVLLCVVCFAGRPVAAAGS